MLTICLTLIFGSIVGWIASILTGKVTQILF